MSGENNLINFNVFKMFSANEEPAKKKKTQGFYLISL